MALTSRIYRRYANHTSNVGFRLHTPINFSIGYNAKKSKVSHLLQFHGPKSDPGFGGMPFSIAITSLGEESANLSAFRTFVRFALVWFCLFPLPLGFWEGLRFVIVALPGLFSDLFLCHLSATDPGIFMSSSLREHMTLPAI